MSATRPKHRIVRRLKAASVLGALMMIGVSPGHAQTGLTATDPNGGAPGEHFTDLVMVPGDTNTASIVIAQDTGESVQAGLRFESLSELGVLHEAVEFTVEGLGTSETMSLDEAMDTGSPFWLGELPSGQEAEVTMTAHLPYETGNETKRREAPFKVLVSAQQIIPKDPEEAVNGLPGAPGDSESAVEGPSPDDFREADTKKADTAPPEEIEADLPRDPLPATGTGALILVLLAIGLLLVGAAVLRVRRQLERSRYISAELEAR